MAFSAINQDLPLLNFLCHNRGEFNVSIKSQTNFSIFAGSAGAAVLGDTILDGVSSIAGANNRTLSFTPVRLPHPLPVYKQQKVSCQLQLVRDR